MSVNESLKSTSSLQVKRQDRPSKRSRLSRSTASVVPSQSENDRNAIMKPPRECECGPDLYSRVLGPTADETILTGLQTVIDLCNKLRVCGDRDESGDEEPERDDTGHDLPERDNIPIQTDDRDVRGSKSQTDPSNVRGSLSQTDPRNLRGSKSQTDDRKLRSSISQTSTTRTMVSAGFQVNPSVATAEAQTETYPEMVSEILQTMGLDAELASKIVQTSFMTINEVPAIQERRASLELANVIMQTSNPSLYSEALQTTYPELTSGFAQTSSRHLPTIRESKTPEPIPRSVSGTQSDRISQSSKQTMAMSDSRLKTPEPIPRSVSGTQSDGISQSSKQTMVSDSRAKLLPEPILTTASGTQYDSISTFSKQTMVVSDNGSCRSIRSVLKPVSENQVTKESTFNVEATSGDEHKCIAPPEPPTKRKTCRCCKCSSSTSQVHRDSSKESTKSNGSRKRKCICCRRTSKCKCSGSRSSASSMHGDKETPREVKYAITRISKYKDFTTFEVMRSTRHKPKQIPKSIEGVFVLKKQKDNNNKSKESTQGSMLKEKSMNSRETNSSSIKA